MFQNTFISRPLFRSHSPSLGAGVGSGVGPGVGLGVGAGIGLGVGAGIGFGVGAGVGLIVGDGVGPGVIIGGGVGENSPVSRGGRPSFRDRVYQGNDNKKVDASCLRGAAESPAHVSCKV